jgi:hypothetical protein
VRCPERSDPAQATPRHATPRHVRHVQQDKVGALLPGVVFLVVLQPDPFLGDGIRGVWVVAPSVPLRGLRVPRSHLGRHQPWGTALRGMLLSSQVTVGVGGEP